MRAALLAFAFVAVAATAGAPAAAHAEPPAAKSAAAASAPAAAAGNLAASPALAPLLVKLGQHGERIEEMKKRGSYTLSGRLEQVDGKGKVDSWKDLVLKILATGTPRPKAQIVSLIEDGEDKTAEAKAKEHKRSLKKHKKKVPEFRVPFLPSEQPSYAFELLGGDARYPGKVKVGFKAKEPSEERFNGSAWVDEKSGEIESMGFSLSQNPTFVDEAEATLVFGTPTELGRAPSELTFEAKGGFLFIRKHYRGHATITDATLKKK